jgi:SAM-dependent methyltransferase
MLPDRPDFSRRASIVERMDEPCSRDELRACLRDIARTNRWTLAYRPLLAWLNELRPMLATMTEPIRILDVGSGYGDGLRRVEHWARERAIDVELRGLDLNPDATAIATEATSNGSGIEWVTDDVLIYAPVKPPHLVICSLFTHHLSDAEIVQFLGWMEQNADLGWFISDLSRAPVPYHFFRIVSKIVRLHPFVQFDGPASILKAFVPADWQLLCAAAGLTQGDYTLRAYKPARLCVERMRPTHDRGRSRDERRKRP